MALSFNEILQNFNEASEYLNAGNIDSAIDLYEKGLKNIKPLVENLSVDQKRCVADSVFYLGDCYMEKGEEQKAYDLYQESINLNVKIGYPYLKIADQHRINNHWKEAIALYNKALDVGNIDQESVNNTYYNLGVCYEEIGDLENAIQSLKKAIQINPDDKEALFNLGMFSARMEHFSDAVNAFEEYLRIDSSSQEADKVRHALQLAKSKLHYNADKDTLNTFDEKFDRATKLSKNGEFDEAIALLKECVQLPNLRIEDRMLAHFNLGFSYSKGLLNDSKAKEMLSQDEINECATNYSFAKHLYDYFIENIESKQNLKQFRDGSGWALQYCIFKLNGGVKYFKGKWSKGSTLCEDFRPFKGYPPDYYVDFETSESSLSNVKTKKSGCFIATAVYNCYNSYQVIILRDFRDNFLSTTLLGKLFINFYYTISVPIAKYIGNRPTLLSFLRKYIFNPIVKIILKRKEL